MEESYKKWYSPTLSTDFEMLIYGHYGVPVLVFPTTMGRFFESADFGLIHSAEKLIRDGKVKLFCVDSIDKQSWYNKSIHPGERIRNHLWYDKFISNEIVDSILHEYQLSKVVVAGASFGGFHAANFAFRHPEKVSHLFSMSGSFDIRNFLDGHYDENVYFNNPVDYLPGNENPALWNLDITLGYGEWDICKDANLKLASILHTKGMDFKSDEWKWAKHDWPLWKMMFPQYLSRL